MALCPSELALVLGDGTLHVASIVAHACCCLDY